MSIPNWFLSLPVLALCLPFVAQEPPSQAVRESLETQRARAQLHYRTVADELRAVDVAQLAPDRAALRAELIGALDRYAERADFGIASRDADGRPATFVDDGGRRCAVAELLHASGRDDVVERVHATHNAAWIGELAQDAELVDWLDRHGLTLFEAARIQAPPANWQGSGEVGLIDYAAPEAGSDTPAPKGGASAPAAAPSGPTTATSAAAKSSAPIGSSATEDGWWVWWELNKAQFLRPQRISLRNLSGSGDDAQEAFDEFIARHRAVLVEEIHTALADADANVRGAALLALGRIGGSDAVERIVAALADPSQTVRHRAILALGSTGAPQALRPLMSLIRTGTVDGTTRVSPVAEPLAIVGAALGRGRAHGSPSEMDAIVTVRVRERATADRTPVGIAAMVYQALAPCASLEALAFELARDEHESIPVRCRAIEALRHSQDERALPLLQNLLVGSKLELRRSAALALGELRQPLALAALLTASELEAESLTRGFILVSIGRRGGETAGKFLLRELERGASTRRAWCALGLGLVARTWDAGAISAKLREAFAREKNRQAEGAYCVALGLARDAHAVPLLRALGREAGRAQTRAYAATALGLIDDEAAHDALAAQVRSERQPQARATAAFALASMGVATDVDMLRRVLVDAREPDVQALAAGALAFHGSTEALATLEQLAQAPRQDEVARAAALDALGVMLDEESPYRLGEAGRQTNSTQMPEWLSAALALSL